MKTATATPRPTDKLRNLTQRSNDIRDATACGQSALASGEHSVDNAKEHAAAEAILWLAWRRGQDVDDAAVVAFLDALCDGTSPLIVPFDRPLIAREGQQ